jgi:hypothetical protein
MRGVILALALVACGPASFTLVAPDDSAADTDTGLPDTGTPPDDAVSYAGDTLMVYQAGEWNEDECTGTFTLSVEPDGSATGYATCTAWTWTAEGDVEGTVSGGTIDGTWTYMVESYTFVGEITGTVDGEAADLHVVVDYDDWTSEGDWSGTATDS